MARFVCLLLAAVCMGFAAITGVVWHVGDQDVNLYCLSLFFVIVALLIEYRVPIRHHAGQ